MAYSKQQVWNISDYLLLSTKLMPFWPVLGEAFWIDVIEIKAIVQLNNLDYLLASKP